MSDVVDSVVCIHSKTEFNVLLSFNKWVVVVSEFLDRYLGQWKTVSEPSAASMFVIVSAENGQFAAGDVIWANAIFDRDGNEARVYEYDVFERKLKAITRDTINARAAAP